MIIGNLSTNQILKDVSTDEVAADRIVDVKEDLINFLQSVLLTVTENQLRNDYREILELTLSFLGAKALPSQKIHFKAPGAKHHTRWMAKIIYSFEIWMFRKQFTLTAREHTGFRDLRVFFSGIYVKACLTGPFAVKTSCSDLHLLKSLDEYKATVSINQFLL